MVSKATRGERNNNPGNIERNPANPWNGRVTDAQYKLTPEFVTNGGRFEVFTDAVWGIRALAVLLMAYQDKHGLRTVRGIINRWAPPGEAKNNTSAYVEHVCSLMQKLPDSILDLHSYEDMEPLVKAIITHENGRNIYSQAQIDDGLFRAGIKTGKKVVVSKAASVAKTAAIAGTAGTVTVAGVTDLIQQAAPAIPVVREAAQAIGGISPTVLIALAVVLVGAAVLWLVLRHRA